MTRAERADADALARATQLAIAGHSARAAAEALGFADAEALLEFLRARRYVGTVHRLEANTGAPPREETHARAAAPAPRHARRR